MKRRLSEVWDQSETVASWAVAAPEPAFAAGIKLQVAREQDYVEVDLDPQIEVRVAQSVRGVLPQRSVAGVLQAAQREHRSGLGAGPQALCQGKGGGFFAFNQWARH